jgi:hypothetical protein
MYVITAYYPVHQLDVALAEQPVPVGGTCVTRARYPVHHRTEAGMARTITIVIDEDLSNEEYAEFGNGIWGVLKMARPEGGLHLEADRSANERWAQHGGEFLWQ